MTSVEICNRLRQELFNNGYEYGFYFEGKKYKPDMSKGFDCEYYDLSTTIYRIQEPADTIREKIGTCVDAVVLMKKILDDYSVSNKIWLLHYKSKNTVHTILTFEAENKIVYLELTPQSGKPWYGKEVIYDSEEDFLMEYSDNGYDVTNITNSIVISQPPDFLLTKL